MYTRVTTIHFQPEKLDEAVRIYQDSILPEAKRQHGFVSTFLLTNEAAATGIAVTSFETAEDVQNSEASGYYQQQADKLAQLLTRPPDKRVFETSLHELSGGTARAARVVPTQLHPGTLDDAQRIFQDAILPEGHHQTGFQGLLLLADRATNRAISMSLWETDRDRQASEASGFYQKQLAKLAHLFVAEPVREVYAVNVQMSAGAMAVVGVDNKTHVYRFFEECWNHNNLALLDQLVDANMVNHDVGNPGFDGLEGQKRLINTYRAAFPDILFGIENLVAEGDMVACHWIMQGTHQGDLQGVPPTGKRVTVPGITLNRVAGGRIVESWSSWDPLDMLQQLGVSPTPEIAPWMQQPGAEQPPIH